MQNVIRTIAAAGLIYLIAMAAGCAAARPDRPTASPRERALATPAAVKDRPKIIAFGDSLTAGFGLAEKESYPYLLQEKLRADGYDLEVVNAGVSGDTTLGGLERADWVLEQDNAKILILELGANDLLRGVPPSQTKANLDKIIRKAKARGLEILLCGMLAPPTPGSENGRDFVMLFPDLATEHKTAFLPFLLENVAAKKELNQADGIHPNAEGERIMTENVYRALKPLLPK